MLKSSRNIFPIDTAVVLSFVLMPTDKTATKDVSVYANLCTNSNFLLSTTSYLSPLPAIKAGPLTIIADRSLADLRIGQSICTARFKAYRKQQK